MVREVLEEGEPLVCEAHVVHKSGGVRGEVNNDLKRERERERERERRRGREGERERERE